MLCSSLAVASLLQKPRRILPVVVIVKFQDDEEPIEVRITGVGRRNCQAESSYMGEEINSFQIGLPENRISSEVEEEIPKMDGMIARLLAIFPQLSPDQALFQLLKTQGQFPQEGILQSAIDHFLRHGVPEHVLDEGRAEVGATESVLPVEVGNSNLRADIDLSGVGPSHKVEERNKFEIQATEPAGDGNLYEDWSLYRLSEDFPLVRMTDLRQAFKAHGGRFTCTYKSVEQSCRDLKDRGKRKAKKDAGTSTDLNTNWTPKIGLRFLKAPRPKKIKPNNICLNFEKEWAELQKQLAGKHKGDILKDQDGCSGTEAGSANEECPSVAEAIECGCCCMEFSFEQMVQCADGHLFCFQCLRRQVEESTFGGLQACHSLPCMDTSGCSESIPMSEVRRALPVDLIERYEQRQAQADIEQARLEGLVYCPFCNFPCEVDEGVRVLECPNSDCSKASCIQCKEPSHIPLRCEEVEKKSETALRRKIEEVMTKAVIRVCNSCKTELVKMDGCNKVTCRCGITMCYICRQTIPKDYTHFCQHAREPGKPCQRCKKCGLWDKELEDDVALKARETALKDLAEQEPKLLSRNIGPPMKKQKESTVCHPPFGLQLHAILPGQHLHWHPPNPLPPNDWFNHQQNPVHFQPPNINLPYDFFYDPPIHEGNENRPVRPIFAAGNQLENGRNQQIPNWPNIPGREL
ncbi:uncharacterized protein LOC131069119 isoform X2 [Cryptomeria japonica]|uniref:uncharacterized protein LOC131069119 isoform X2 n=1 Tax=Cryptomeria japonica TaxID=3369 RepID=UPI0027DA869B|nr:uncharacterized protein LOC131069119 isoform X2 [Cryptomeria japonica]